MHSQSEDIDSRLSFSRLLKKSPEQPQISLRRQLDLYYKTRETPNNQGRCVILNYKSFASGQLIQRTWSKLDVDLLRSTFEQLKFTVQLYEDLSYNKTINLIRTESQREDNQHVECFVLFILSHQVTLRHGKLEFQCADRSISIELAIDQLTRPTSNLAGKPKLFFIEAGDHSLPPRVSKGTMKHDGILEPTCRQYRIPRFADCLIFYLTYSDYQLSRLEENGSEYIRIICDILRDHSHKHDLMTLLTMISRTVQITSDNSDNSAALVQIMSTLTRLIRFGPTD